MYFTKPTEIINYFKNKTMLDNPQQINKDNFNQIRSINANPFSFYKFEIKSIYVPT